MAETGHEVAVGVVADRPSSIWEGNDRDFLQWAVPFYWREGGEPDVLDINYGRGLFWRGTPSPTVSLDHSTPANIRADNRYLPFQCGTFDIVVYDPPHMDDNHGITLARYASGVPEIGTVLPEVSRVLRAGGLLLSKITDAVHAQYSHWPHVELMAQSPCYGLVVCDLIIKTRAAALIDPKWKNAYHARKRHCFWIVCRKGKC